VHLVFADCDGVSDFADFATPKEADLACQGVGEGFRTPSGRYKRVLAVRSDGRPMTRAKAWRVLETYVPELVADPAFSVDKLGLTESFVDEAGLAAVMRCLDSLPLPAVELTWEYRKLSKTVRSRFDELTDAQFAFVEKLMAASTLNLSFALPTTYWAKEMRSTTSRIASRIRLLASTGLLEEVCDTYVPGRRSRTYRAAGKLLTEWHRQRARNFRHSALEQHSAVPGPGRWHAYVWQQSARFSGLSLDSFLDFLKNCEGFSSIDRVDKARRAWEYRVRWRRSCGTVGNDEEDHLQDLRAG
jgi:hypothetical protein